MPRYYVTVGPEDPAEHPGAVTPTWALDAADEDAARDRAELAYRRDHPEVQRLRVRVTPERSDL